MDQGLEASAAGIPFIASDMPGVPHVLRRAERDSLQRPKDWSAAFERITDPEERKKLSIAGRARSEEFDIAKNWHRWERVYETLRKERAA